MQRECRRFRHTPSLVTGAGFFPYRKLAGILEQNVKEWFKSLTPVLEAEMEAAFEQRKNLARRLR